MRLSKQKTWIKLYPFQHLFCACTQDYLCVCQRFGWRNTCLHFICINVYVKTVNDQDSVKLGNFNKSHSCCQVQLNRCKQPSCAQLAVGKLLWDLYCRNALAGNSSLSFILFVCVKFPPWPHPFSHPVPGFVHPSTGRTLSVLTSSWLLQSHPSTARLPLGSFFTSHLHLPDLLTEPLTCSVFYCTGKQKNTNAAPHFSRPLFASHGGDWVGWGWMWNEVLLRKTGR